MHSLLPTPLSHGYKYKYKYKYIYIYIQLQIILNAIFKLVTIKETIFFITVFEFSIIK